MTIIRSTEPFGSFRVTFNTVTEESCQNGDHYDSGYLDYNGSPVDEYYKSDWSFRDLYDHLRGYRAEGDGDKVPRWITIENGSDDLFTSRFWQQFTDPDTIGATVSIHRPDWITDSSWLRVCRILGWRNLY